MTHSWQGGNFAQGANDRFAPFYDAFTGRCQNTRWTGRLLERAQAAGLSGNQLLDVACGTGLSSLPMLERGFSVTGCDVSKEMLSIAHSKVGDRAELHWADMRELPVFGSFDLIWAVNESVNQLLSIEELVAFLQGMRRNLAQEGLIVFDTYTLQAFLNRFAAIQDIDLDGRQCRWSGMVDPKEVKAGLMGEARFEVVGEAGSVHIHRHRHYPEGEVRMALSACGLELVELSGYRHGELRRPMAEWVDGKAVYVSRRMAPSHPWAPDTSLPHPREA